MKKLSMNIISLIVLSVAGSTFADGLTYERTGTFGEGAEFYVAEKEVNIDIRRGPSVQLEKDYPCVLPKGYKSRLSELVKTTQLGIYEASKDGTEFFTYRLDGPNVEVQTWKFQKGQIVREVGNRGEGECEVEFETPTGELYQGTADCLTPGFGFKQIQELEDDAWFFLSCKASSGWASTSDLKEVDGLKTVFAEH